ncbi:hypothetical protein NM208_g6643 [Fusarium decemcellulare]|uniref:Uncharacterized protein n=1 Tax=Fusarium decemcellulare TaxID=57161 RepID=A0ACC1SC56_9HYPO|nr:hypothetical protein NM208_g6643 [Fusarium decemcellulare]
MSSNARPGIAVTIGDVNVGAGATAIIGTNQVGSTLETEQQIAKDCKNTLFVSKPSSVRAELISFKGDLVQGTCEWIRHNDTYRSWLQANDSQLLWISGGPGRGKTMLSIFLTHELETLASHSSALMLYVFCGDKSHSTEIAILRSLLYQILDKSPTMAKHATAVRERSGHTLTSRQELWRIFVHMIRDPELGPILCLIDGLDECHPESTRWFLQNLKTIFDKGLPFTKRPPQSFKLAVVSRDMPGLRCYLRLDLDSKASIALDVVRVIDAKIEEHEIFSEIDSNFIKEVKETLVRRSDGTFLWVGFAIRELLLAETRTEMRHALEAMPQGLDAFYARILLQIKAYWRRDIARLLRWVIHARRSLTAPELADALTVEVQTIRDLVTMSGSLLTWDKEEISTRKPYKRLISLSSASEGHDESGHSAFREYFEPKVKLLHASVSDFLRGKAENSIQVPDEFHIDGEKAEFEMAQRCLDTVETGFSDPKQHDLGYYTFLSYAACFWAEHTRRCGQHIDRLWDKKLTFFQSNDPRSVRLGWWLKYRKLREFHNSGDTNISLLLVCSALGLLPLVDKLLQERQNIDYEDALGLTALDYALQAGYVSVAQLLVDHGASLTRAIKGQGGSRTIHLAMWLGPELAEPFLNNALARCSLNPLKRWLWFRDVGLERSLFQEAVDQGDEKFVKMLLKKGAILDSEIASQVFRAALGREKSSALVELLLKNGADANSRNPIGQTALHEVLRSSNYHEGYQKAKVLVDHGADVNARDERGQTLLFDFWIHQNQDNVKFLLDHGANINARDKNSQTPLFRMVPYQHIAVIRLLIERGADVEVKDDKGTTLLQWVVLNRRVDIAEALLQHGADPNGRNDLDMTPLYLNSTLGPDDGFSIGARASVMAELLIKWGANSQAG